MSAVIHPAKQATSCCKATLPSFQAVKLLTLSSFSCHTAPKVQHTHKSGSNSRPRQIQTRIQTDPDPIQTTTSSVYFRVKTCDCSVSFLSSSCWFTIHEIWNSCRPEPRVLKVKLNPSVNTMAGLAVSIPDLSATDSRKHFMSYHLGSWRPLDHTPLRNPLVPDVRITAGRSRGFLEPHPYVYIYIYIVWYIYIYRFLLLMEEKSWSCSDQIYIYIHPKEKNGNPS